MTKNQIHNLFYYLGIMLLDNKIISTSPDYLIEKSLSFFGNSGKNVFISDIKNKFFSQKLPDNKYDGYGFWFAYCKTWNVKQDDYEIMNILNFILSCNIKNHKNIIMNFEKYIGSVDVISDSDLSYKLQNC